MTRQYFYLLQQNVSCKNRYKRLLNICFPELEKIFKSTRIYDDTALNFIKEFPHAEIVKENELMHCIIIYTRLMEEIWISIKDYQKQ